MTDINLTKQADGSTDAEIIEGNVDVTIHDVTIKGDTSGPNPVDPPIDPLPVDPPPVDKPVVAFVFEQLKGLIGKVINQSTGLDGLAFYIAWGVSKDSSQVGERGATTYRYPAVGPYIVTVRCKAADGTIYSASQDVVVTDLGTTPPVEPPPSNDKPPVSPPPPPPPPGTSPPATSANGAVAGLTAVLAPDGVSVLVTDTTVKGKQNLFSAKLDFGDPEDAENSVTIKQNHSIWHVYKKPGNYPIVLISRDADNELCSATTTVEVTGELPAFPTPQAGDTDAVVTGMVAGGDTFGLAVPPGDIGRIFADARGGSIKHYSDGAVCLENMYASCVADLCVYVIVTQGGKELYRGNLPLWAHTGARPRWYIEPQVVADPDLSLAPKYLPGGEKASVYAAYMATDNSPMGAGMIRWDMGGTGGDIDMGPGLPGWDAPWFANPTKENAIVVRGMADAARVEPFHVRDDKTNEMLRVTDYPHATFNFAAGVKASENPIQPFATSCILDLEQAMAHAPIFNAAACIIFGGTQYDKEELSMWAMYVECLWCAYPHHLPCGAVGTLAGQVRGAGRGLAVVLYASKLSDRAAYFQTWVDGIGANYNERFLAYPPGIHVMHGDGTTPGPYPHGDYAPWQNHYNNYSLGLALDFGNTKEQAILDHTTTDYQDVFDWFALNTIDSVVIGPWPIASTYEMALVAADGKSIVADWAEAVKQMATYNTQIAAALPLDPTTQAFQDALVGPNKGYLPGDFFGYPWAPGSYVAMLGAALAQIRDHATDQVRAKQAWDIFMKYNRAPWSGWSIAARAAG